MKKLILITLFAFLCLSVKAQKLTEYKASNGITYHEKDTVSIGKGTGGNAEFLYMQLTGFAAAMTYNMYKGPDQLNMGRAYQNTFAIINRMKLEGDKNKEKAVFYVTLAKGVRCRVVIDDAIQACEVIPCQDNSLPQTGIADELLKLKKLLDMGGLTQAEYDAQKKKLLNQ